MNRIFKKIVEDKTLYILTNFFVSGVSFLRSFIFMSELDIKELGMITLMQTIIMFVALFQFGFINGGYRIYSLNIQQRNIQINNFLFSFFGVISLVMIMLWIFLSLFYKNQNLSSVLVLISIITGIFSLIQSWLTNTLIARRLLFKLNKINLISSSVSLISLFFIPYLGFNGALIALYSLPLSFILLAFLTCKELKPTRFLFRISIAKYILKYGFIPFLAGIIVLLNAQIERWSITSFLGITELGNYYLVFIYSTLFVMFPASLLNVFFPRCILAYENNDMNNFKRLLSKHLTFLIIYCLFITLFSVFFLYKLVDVFFPSHINNVIYVIYYLPGLFALVLCDPMSLIFNSTVRLKPILWAGISSVFLNLGLILLTNYWKCYDLITVSIIKSSIHMYVLLFYVLYILFHWKEILKIRKI